MFRVAVNQIAVVLWVSNLRESSCNKTTKINKTKAYHPTNDNLGPLVIAYATCVMAKLTKIYGYKYNLRAILQASLKLDIHSGFIRIRTQMPGTLH